MKNTGISTLIVATLLLSMGITSNANAGLMSCDSTDPSYIRTWEFDSADACGTGPGNPNSSADIEALGGLFASTTPWFKQGDVTIGGDFSALLNINLISGSWDGKDIDATWTLLAGFWNTYSSAVFTVHVGGEPGDLPDDFGAFVITPGEYTGDWSYVQDPTTGGGGGLSNVSIWTPVPEPTTLMLLGLGLLGFALQRRRQLKAG